MNIGDKVERLIRPEIRASYAYTVPEATGMVKLDAMENPYPWPPEVKQAWLEVLREIDVNRYPDPDPRRLKQLLREAMGAPVGTALLLGNGSDELIQIVLLALARPDACVLAPVPTFVMYEVIANAVGMRFVGVPLDQDFALDAPSMREAMRRHKPAVTFIAYPNNPSGNLFALDAIESLIAETVGLIVIDGGLFRLHRCQLYRSPQSFRQPAGVAHIVEDRPSGAALRNPARCRGLASRVQQSKVALQYQQSDASQRGAGVKKARFYCRAGKAYPCRTATAGCRTR